MEEQTAEETPGDDGLRLVLGLGNPGERYAGTRHNLGFRVVGELAARRGLVLDRLECNALVGGPAGGLLLAEPLTFMNRSGHAARCLVERHRLAAAALLVVYDEASLPLGRLRLRPGGSPGGHRGMESVIAALHSDQVPRLRLGIAGAEGPPAGDELVRFVLEPFAAAELGPVEEMIARAADACEAWIEAGTEAAMNRFNG